MDLGSHRLFLIGLAMLLIADPVAAADNAGTRSDQPPIVNADAAIAACESRYSEALNSGVEKKMQRGRLGVVRCIRSAALEHAVAFLGQDRRESISASFDDLERGFEEFYKVLYDEARGSFHPSYVTELRDVYVDILHDVLRQRKLHQPM